MGVDPAAAIRNDGQRRFCGYRQSAGLRPSARQHIAVVEHRADGPCTNVPVLTRALVMCPNGDS